MPTCEACGADGSWSGRTCSYCGGRYCPDHRLPEKHDCDGLATVPASVAGAASEPRQTPEPIRPQTVGATREESLDRGPDIAPDGSLRQPETTQDDGDDGRRQSLFGRLLSWLL